MVHETVGKMMTFVDANRNWSMNLTCFIAALLLAVCVVLPSRCRAACNCGYGDGRFTTHSGIFIDGSMSDWASVHSDLDNNSCDATGPSDRDHIVQSTGRDLLHFAYTWNDTHVQVYTARLASSSNQQQFIYYADANNNGFMETGERVIVATWKGSNRLVDLFLGYYASSGSGGDPMVDGDGWADGYMLPGTVTGLPPSGQPDYSGNWGSSDGLSMEWQVPWSVIGVPAGSAFTFHVSSTNSNPGAASFPDQVDDNMGGCGGGAASTQYAGLAFTPDRELQGILGIVYAAHVLTNEGNGSDTFNFSSIPSGDFLPTFIAYYHDADGSGDFTAGDVLLEDTDDDTTIDSGLLPSGESLNILIAYGISAGSAGDTTVVTTAVSAFDANKSAFVTDTLSMSAPDLVIMKTVSTQSDPVNGASTDAKAIPGALMRYTIIVTNTGGGAVDADTVTITDPIPVNTAFYLGDGTTSPVTFTPNGSGLTFTFSGLTSVSDDLDFINAGGSVFDPTLDPVTGCDETIRSIRIHPKGMFNPSTGVPHPGFQIEFLVRVR